MPGTRAVWLRIGIALWLGWAMLLGRAAAEEPRVRVMSFNVRYGTANDGENHWERRKEFLLETIRKFDPDLLGTQELLASQADFLRERLEGYHFIGVGRDDGQRGGEFSALLVRGDRFKLLDSGHFWLSETPEKPGSKSWDSSLTRMASWARLEDARQPGMPLLCLNTHYDHIGVQARAESAKLIRRWLVERATGAALIVMGDFNTSETTEPYRHLVNTDGGLPRLVDTYRAVFPQRQPDEATFHGFTGHTEGHRIDWILCSPELSPLEAAIDRAQRDGRYPSDHYPVTATLQWNGAAGK